MEPMCIAGEVADLCPNLDHRQIAQIINHDMKNRYVIVEKHRNGKPNTYTITIEGREYLERYKTRGTPQYRRYQKTRVVGILAKKMC